MRTLAAALVAAFLLLVPRSQGQGQEGIAINWAGVPANPTQTILNGSIGQCICNLHAVGCDPNCCCDGACSTQARANGFTACNMQVTSWRTFTKCFDDSGASKVVWTTNGEFLDAREPGEAAVCLVYDNFNNNIAFTFTVPPALDASAITTPVPQDWFTPLEHTVFKAGDRLPVVYATVVGGNLRNVVRNSGYVTIPTAGPGGACRFDQTVGFMDPLKATRCAAVGTISAVCDAGSTDRFLSMALTGPNYAVTTLVPVVARLYDWSTGNLISTLDPTNRLNGDVTSPAGLAAAATVLSGLTCQNFVRAAALKAVYDFPTDGGAGRIVNASVDIWVSSITAQSTSQPLRVLREFVVTFKEFSSAAFPSLRKGTPGYLAGDTINAGTLVTQGALSAVNQRLFGFEVPQGRFCSDGETRQVKFLHNIVDAGCAVQLTEPQLQTLCASATGTSAMLSSMLQTSVAMRSLLATTNASGIVDQIGRTADADPTNVNDWIPVRGDPTAGTTAVLYQNIQRRCDNLVVGVHYTFVVGRAGVEYNPQDIVVGAKAEPIIGAWLIRNDTDPSGLGLNYFTFRVSFVRYPDIVKSRRVVPPRVLPATTDDVFYPFRYPGTDNGVE